MMPIQFQTEVNLPVNKVIDLYENAGWNNYTLQPQKLMKAISHSLFVLSAWEGDTLVGLLRAVGDGLTIVYVQDILISKRYRRKGIGTELLKATLKQYEHVRQIVLLTDQQEETISFYESVGLIPTNTLKLISFIRLKD